jgi:hypothetical protein
VSAALLFDAWANGSSVEDTPEDNRCRAQLQRIKEADLQLVS